jgi:hypothetical protein
MTCQARPTRDNQIRCVACRRVWDADDEQVCPREVELVPDEVEGYVSALAPDYLS